MRLRQTKRAWDRRGHKLLFACLPACLLQGKRSGKRIVSIQVRCMAG